MDLQKESAAPASTAPLLAALEQLREQVHGLALPLETVGADTARAERTSMLDQLDDYLLPRLRRIDAPLLAVVGGSTGAGKSTLVNSLLRERVSRSGVLRPTTRSPVLVHHPDDAEWFGSDHVLPNLARLTGDDPEPTREDTDRKITSVRLGTSASLPPGLALLDAPDIDSVVDTNRELATQLLAAGDLWLFVTTASRYADAVPWDLLRTAVERGTSVAVVLDRVPPDAMAEVRTHLAQMLRDNGLGTAPLFTVRRVGPAHRRRAAAAAGGGAAAVVAHRPGVQLARPGARGPSHARRRPHLARQARPGARRRRRPAGRGRRPAAHGGAVRVRGGGPAARAGPHRRLPPARRGARPVAGVRRHGRVLPRAGVGRRPPARPRSCRP